MGESVRSLGGTPTWSIATVLCLLIAISLLVERSIHRFTTWLKKTYRKPLLAAVTKMRDELMLLGFISLLLTATSHLISRICVPSKLFNSRFTICGSQRGKMLTEDQTKCPEDYESIVPYEGLEQIHRFIFVMAVTHITVSCLTMLLAIIKIHSWRVWEEEAETDAHIDRASEITRSMTMRRQSSFVSGNLSNAMHRNSFLVWVICFVRQFGNSVGRADYLTMRHAFNTNHNFGPKWNFHSYIVDSMEEEFQEIVGLGAKHWGFVVLFVLFNVKGLNLYLWISCIPMGVVLIMGTKLQHVIATLALESVGISGSNLMPRDDLFWFGKPRLLLPLVHFIVFQHAFELASFFWYWWQFGYNSCFMEGHKFVYARISIGFVGQVLCSYSTLPLYALVTQMGTHYKPAVFSPRLRKWIHRWEKRAKKKRRPDINNEIELQQSDNGNSNGDGDGNGNDMSVSNHTSPSAIAPLLLPQENVFRSCSFPGAVLRVPISTTPSHTITLPQIVSGSYS